jgi:photosystem II stability/assembly factor-like uncharacterized protein
MGHHLFYLLRSEDGGNSWEVQAEPPDSVTTCHRTAITFLGSQHGWMTSQCPFELGGGVFLETTSNGGDTWERLTSMQADGFGWAFGMEISKTLDFGLTWERVKIVSWEGQFSFIDHERGWAVARSGEEIALVQTIDGGRTWQELDPVVAPSVA